MSNPFVQFPFVTETAEGLVHSGVFGPIADGTFTVVAICPQSRRKPYYETGYRGYDQALQAAKTAYLWFDKDEPQIQPELVSSP